MRQKQVSVTFLSDYFSAYEETLSARSFRFEKTLLSLQQKIPIVCICGNILIVTSSWRHISVYLYVYVCLLGNSSSRITEAKMKKFNGYILYRRMITYIKFHSDLTILKEINNVWNWWKLHIFSLIDFSFSSQYDRWKR